MKLWNKGYEIDPLIEEYTVGNDYILDLELLPFDCTATRVHADMLRKIGILNDEEYRETVCALEEIVNQARNGEFRIRCSDEDCHTAIENSLTRKIGETGKKIHTARSRNDQVLTALRLYCKDRLFTIRTRMSDLVAAIEDFVQKYGDTVFPGYTHTRKAMPLTIKVWANGLKDSMKDNQDQLTGLMGLIDQSPLGTGAGFGVPLNIDRGFTAAELGFSRIQENPVYAQNSRAKFDGAVMSLLTFVMYDLNKYSSDLILFTDSRYGYFKLPDAFLTGSSIMPHKKNPDVLELMRANYHRLLGFETQVKTLGSNLISGYHRDFQLLKEPLMTGFRILDRSLSIFQLVWENMKVDREKCRKDLTDELFSTQRLYELVNQGMSFRDAYRLIAGG